MAVIAAGTMVLDGLLCRPGWLQTSGGRIAACSPGPPHQPADFDFPKVPLTRLLDDAASSFPANTALAFLGTKLT